MKIRKLHIDDFKNLRDFAVAFGEHPFTTVVLGRNGTGKSNLLEALIIIFCNLDLGEKPAFKYQLEYECRGNIIWVDADPARARRDQVQITVKRPDMLIAAGISYSQFHSDPERYYLPSYVFGYYSGPSNRMEKHFDRHQERFYRALLDGQVRPLRPLLYARPVHSQFALLSFFIEEDQQILEFLSEHLNIKGMEAVLFVLHEPRQPWNKTMGDARFWHARGAVSQFLGYLYDLALVPMRFKVRITSEFSGTNLEHLYLYLQSTEDLKRLASHYPNRQEFFKALESTYISKILSEVRIEVQVKNADGSLTFRDLSEGEQQLLMVLGLLRFTKEDEALFLLDEPDTHLNPAWSVQYLEFMKQVVGGDQPTSHVIMTTHNPLVISSLRREDVRIMQRARRGENGEQESIRAVLPDEDPQGMGVAAILTSDLFGLRSTLDTPTQTDLDKRRKLAFSDEQLSDADEQELNNLNQKLANLDFSITVRDPLYQSFASEYRDFVKEYTRQAAPDLKEGIVFTPEQRQRQRELTRQIMRELKAQRGQHL